MAINHIFLNTPFGNGFHTHNAILDITPYKPEVMFIGTFNPKTPNANFADFFYGRNYFWTGFKNLFIYNAPVIPGRRMPPNGVPPPILNPTLEEILELCKTLKLTFADLIKCVLNNGNPPYHFLPNDNIIYNGNEYNLIQDGQRGAIRGLAQLDRVLQVSWNTQNIIKYLCENPQIHTIYLTRRPTGIWGREWRLILNSPCMKGRRLTNIFTPSAAGSPVNHSMIRLLHHWVHNINPNFGKLESTWLVNNGVNPNNF